MAKAPAPAKEEAAPTPPPKKRKKLVIILLAIVLIVVLVAGGVVGLLLMKRGSADDTSVEESAAPVSTGVDLSRPPAFVSMDPFVVNLSPEEGDRYLQVIMVFRVVDAATGEKLKNFMPEIRHRINLILSSKLPSEVATQQGREDLSIQIAEEVNSVLGAPPGGPAGPIQSVLFNSFIVQ